MVSEVVKWKDQDKLTDTKGRRIGTRYQAYQWRHLQQITRTQCPE